MGSFSSSCAVSNLPISSGDDVLWIYAKKGWIKTTHELSDLVWRYEERVQDSIKFRKENEEFAKQFPGEDNILWDSFWTNPPEKEFEWGFGKYDDYGWVEGEDEVPDKLWDTKILVRKSVADKMAAFGKTLISREWYEKKPYLVDSYLYCFLLVCQLTRIHLFGHFFLGRQDPDVQEMREQKVVRKIISQEFTKLSNQIFMEDLEYKNWSWRVGLEYKFRKFVNSLLGRKEK